MSIIELNNNVRAVIAEGAFAMMLVTGTDKVRSGYGNGDSLLVDVDHWVFAVADATERFPHASRSLLSNIAKGLSTVPQDLQSWRDFCNAIFAKQEYHLKSTMSLIALQQNNDKTVAFIAHGGDSSLKIYSRQTNTELFSTTVNMNFAGRSKSLNEIKSLNLRESTRVILYSDGFNDLVKLCSLNIRTMVGCTFMEALSGIMHHLNNLNDAEYDDISFLMFDIPEIFTIHSSGILMGGTTHIEEQNKDRHIAIYTYDSLIL